MQKDKILDDLAQLAGGTVNAISGIGRNIHAEIKSRVEETIDRLDLVPRSDFERLEATVQKLNTRIEALEAEKKPATKTKKKTTGSK